jgi:hypothetical protein
MPEIFVFEPDLIFSSKFEGFSRLSGINFRIFTTIEEFVKAFGGKPQALIINLDLVRSEILLKLTGYGYPVLGYYSHVNSATAKAALEMGVGYVVSRGALVSDPVTLLRRLLSTEN